MKTEDQNELPHVEHLGTDVIEFPRLDTDELLSWANEVKAKLVADEDRRLKADTSLRGQVKLQQELLQNFILKCDVEFGHLYQKTYTPAGQQKALVLSLRKAKRPDAEILGILKRIHFTRKREIAGIVLSPPEPEMLEGEQSVPPAESSQSDGTGSSSAPSSVDTLESESPGA